MLRLIFMSGFSLFEICPHDQIILKVFFVYIHKKFFNVCKAKWDGQSFLIVDTLWGDKVSMLTIYIPTQTLEGD